MQTNIPCDVQANIEQVTPASGKQNTEYYLEAMTYNFSNKDNHLSNDMIIFLSANFTRVGTTQIEC